VVRARLEERLAARVVEARTQGSGFTPGFASRLRLADGHCVFVKAANDRLPWLVESYREEAAKLSLLPATVPAPRLQQVIDEPLEDTGWVLLVFDDVEGRPPDRPWSLADARSALRTATALAEALTPPPTGWPWGTLADVIFDDPPDWAGLAERPEWSAHLGDLAELADRRTELLAGNTLGHSDLRDDNLILTADGTYWICDWNWPTVGPRWADAVTLAISMYGDGLDAEALLAETGLVGEDDREAVDCLLAALTGFFLLWSVKPFSPTSPYLRAHQVWYAEVTGTWLKERRGWH
jgi:Phosphotransferase enzyme family